ncbi:MAG: hypothetical protein K8S87_00710, partial [Planctomycetes bacterium]|nr:hypothetical protein [Planctomycetota bacterium]
TFREVYVDGVEGVRHFNFERLSKVADQPEDKRFPELPELLFDQEAINNDFVSVTPLSDALLNREMLRKLAEMPTNQPNFKKQ